MDFGPIEMNADTIALWHSVRSFLDEHVTSGLLEHEWSCGEGVDPHLHRLLGEQGWLEPMLAIPDGGIEASPIESTIIERELRAHDVPMVAHLSSKMVADTVRAHGSDQLKRSILGPIARGEVLISLGYTEPDVGSDLANVATRAERDGDGWTLTGQKLFTTAAQHCHYCFVLARTDPEGPPHRGLTMFLVPTPSPGVEIRAIQTLGGERTNVVFFDGVRVPDDLRVGDVHAGWSVLNGADGALSAEHGSGDEALDGTTLNWKALAVLRRAADSAIEWAARPDPAGCRPIDDPAVRRRLARVLVDLEVAGVAPPVFSRVISTTVLVAGARDLLQLLGPEGQTDDGSVCAWVSHAYRFAPGTGIYGGTIDIFRNMIAEQRLGLPRSRPPRPAKSAKA